MELSKVSSTKKDPWAGFKRKHTEQLQEVDNKG